MNTFSKKELAKYKFDAENPVKKHQDTDIVQVSVDDAEDHVRLSIFMDYTHVVLRDEKDGEIVRTKLRTLDSSRDTRCLCRAICNTLFEHRKKLESLMPGTLWFKGSGIREWEVGVKNLLQCPIMRIQELGVEERKIVEGKIKLDQELGFTGYSKDSEFFEYVMNHLNPRIQFYDLGGDVYDPFRNEYINLGYVHCPLCGKTYRTTEVIGIPNYTRTERPRTKRCSECETVLFVDRFVRVKHWTDFRSENGCLYIERYEILNEYPEIEKEGSIPKAIPKYIHFEKGLRIRDGKAVQKEYAETHDKDYRTLTFCPVLDVVFHNCDITDAEDSMIWDKWNAEKDHINFDGLNKALKEYGKYTEEEEQKIIKAMNTFPTDYSIFLNPSKN